MELSLGKRCRREGPQGQFANSGANWLCHPKIGHIFNFEGKYRRVWGTTVPTSILELPTPDRREATQNKALRSLSNLKESHNHFRIMRHRFLIRIKNCHVIAWSYNEFWVKMLQDNIATKSGFELFFVINGPAFVADYRYLTSALRTKI